MYEGHIVPDSFLRHAPMPPHCSAARDSPPKSAKSKAVSMSRVEYRGVQQSFGIKRPLHFAERAIQIRPVHFLLERAADQSISMLARQRPSVFEYQVRNLLGDPGKPGDAVGFFQIDHGPHM
jgi:hypothetical protein